jgi:hypothetical protein
LPEDVSAADWSAVSDFLDLEDFFVEVEGAEESVVAWSGALFFDLDFEVVAPVVKESSVVVFFFFDFVVLVSVWSPVCCARAVEVGTERVPAKSNRAANTARYRVLRLFFISGGPFARSGYASNLHTGMCAPGRDRSGKNRLPVFHG